MTGSRVVLSASLVLTLALAIVATSAAPVAAIGTPGDVDETQDVVIRFDDDADGRPQFVAASLTDSEMEALDSHPMVEDIEELTGGTIAEVDIERSLQWEFTTTAIEAVWDHTRGDESIVIAVLDTGVTPMPDLAGRLLPGTSFTSGLAQTDLNGHGTAVALVAAAGIDNGIGGVGACPQCSVLPVQVAQADGTVRWDRAARGIIWAVDQGADVINMSFGGFVGSDLLEDAIGYATDKGVVVVAAAGNYERTDPYYPAAYTGAIAVGAHDESGTRYSFSNFGTWVDLAAPGCVWVSTPVGQSRCGTSFASPIVAGAAALLRSVDTSAATTTSTLETSTFTTTWTRFGNLDGTKLAEALEPDVPEPDVTTEPAVTPSRVIATPQPSPTVAIPRFADVAPHAYYADAVTWLATNGISTGTTPTTFSPDQPLTRAQAATLLWRAEGSPTT
ncbi:MAG: S8 family serine peptidase [Acidimicrobiales bacterium]